MFVFLRMAVRNVFRNKRRTALTVSAMAFGLAITLCGLGLQLESYDRMINMATRTFIGHIQVHEKGYHEEQSSFETIEADEPLMESLEKIPGVDAVSARVFSPGLFSFGSETAGGFLLGCDPRREDQLSGLTDKLKAGRLLSESPAKEVVIGVKLAENLEIGLDDQLMFVGQAADGSIAADLYTVVGLLSTGLDDVDQMAVYVHLDDARDVLALEGKVHELAFALEDLRDLPEVKEAVTAEVGGPDREVLAWDEVIPELAATIEVDRMGGLSMYLVIFFVVALGVMNTLLMAVFDRTREFGVMIALGTRPGQVARLILLEALVLALLSILIGGTLGYLGNEWMAGGIPLPSSGGEAVEVLGMRMDMMWASNRLDVFLGSAAFVLVTALLVSIYPALRAARLPAAEAMRRH